MEGGLPGKGESSARMILAEMHSNVALAVLAPVNLNEKGIEISALAEDWHGCAWSRQCFLHQLGDVLVMYGSAAPLGGQVKDEERSKLF